MKRGPRGLPMDLSTTVQTVRLQRAAIAYSVVGLSVSELAPKSSVSLISTREGTKAIMRIELE